MTSTNTQQSIEIKGIQEPIITQYFLTINQEQFRATAALFAEDGELDAPFEKPIIGRSAIASYLQEAAKGMELLPHQGNCQTINNELKQIEVIGKVKTALFSVNVAWYFQLNLNQEIIKVKVKLLASPQELFKLKNTQNQINL